MTEKPIDQAQPTYDKHGTRIMTLWGVVGAIAAIASLVICVLAATRGLSGGKAPIALLAAAWAILPPIWFWWEYFGMYRTTHSNKGTWELFKHGQQLGVAVWAGIAASIGAFALSPLSDPQPVEATVSCAIASLAVSPASSASPSRPDTPPGTFELRLRCTR